MNSYKKALLFTSLLISSTILMAGGPAHTSAAAAAAPTAPTSRYGDVTSLPLSRAVEAYKDILNRLNMAFHMNNLTLNQAQNELEVARQIIASHDSDKFFSIAVGFDKGSLLGPIQGLVIRIHIKKELATPQEIENALAGLKLLDFVQQGDIDTATLRNVLQSAKAPGA